MRSAAHGAGGMEISGCMGTERVHGDWEGAWGLGGCMGTGRVHGDWEGAWGLGGCMGTGRVHGDWEGAWGLGGCMGTGRVHGDWEGAWGLGGCIKYCTFPCFLHHYSHIKSLFDTEVLYLLLTLHNTCTSDNVHMQKSPMYINSTCSITVLANQNNN